MTLKGFKDIHNNVYTFAMNYPIGTILYFAENVSPAELYGGTWERIKDVFLMAAGDTYDVGSTGGEAEHTLTVDEVTQDIW